MWPKMICFQPFCAAEVEGLLHRPQADVAFAHLGARLGVHVAADQHRRAAGTSASDVSRGSPPGIPPAAAWALRIVAQNPAAPGEHLLGGDRHKVTPVVVLPAQIVGLAAELIGQAE